MLPNPQKPIFHESAIHHDEDEWAKVQHSGYTGLTGSSKHPDWYTPGGEEMHEIVKRLWDPKEFECAWVSGVNV